MEPGLPGARLDLKGDRDNLRYGGLEKSTIPRYRLAGQGYLIGLGRTFRIRPGSSSTRVTVAIGADASRREKHDSLLAAVPQPRLNIINKRDVSRHPIEEQANFISIRSSTSSRKRRRVSGPQHPFSIIEAPGEDESDQSSATSDEDSDGPNPTDAYEAFRNDRSQQRQRELLKRTTSDPQDVQAWFALIDHQEDLVRLSGGENHVLSVGQRRTLAELRIGLFEDALFKVVDPTARQRLIHGLIREGTKIWDFARQLIEWKKLLSKDASFELRVLHLNFLMSNPSTFAYEECLNTISEYLDLHKSGASSATRDEHLVYLLLRATLFMKQAGYVERAAAIWQANLEFNFFGSQDGDARELENSFEDFWDNELPRLGETGARGWNAPPSAATVPGASTGTSVLPLHSQAGQYAQSQSNQPDHAWAAAERSGQRFWPAKTMDDVVDPYGIALFTDISQYLLRLSTNETKSNLLDAFLCFSGLPPLNRGHRGLDAFLYQPEALCPFTGVVDSTSLFAAPSDPYAAFWRLESSEQYSFAAAVIRQLALAQSSNEMLAEYAIALELAVKPAEAKRLAKRLLKQRPESARLYNAYALVECRLDKFDAAEKVWATTTDQKATQGQSISDCSYLYHAWIWEAMVRQHPSTNIRSLFERLADTMSGLEKKVIASSESGQDRWSQISEDYLRAQLFKAYSQSIWDDLVVCVDLLVLLQYDIVNHDLQAALATYQQVLSMTGLRLDSSDNRAETVAAAVEKLHTHRARLIKLHTTTPGLQYRPKDVLATLRSSCQVFPTNSVFRQLTRDLAQKHGFIDRLRDNNNDATGAVATSTPTSSTAAIEQHLANITTEMARAAAHGGTQHGVRAAFQKAKEDDGTSGAAARSCPAIQLGHLRWELSLLRDASGNCSSTIAAAIRTTKAASDKKALKQQVQRVKSAFSQAVAACPWVKEIYLAYFDAALEGVVDDWRETYEAMLERGLRVYIELS